MTKLNAVVALEKGLKGRTDADITHIYHTLQKPALFSGLSRVYQPKDEDGDQLPPERTRVQETVEKQLDVAAEKLTNLFDVVATKEWGNTGAKADVKVGDVVIVKDAPVSYLLFLEKALINWRTMVSKLPLLDPSEVWTYDDSTGVYRTEPTGTVRTKKVPRVLTKAPATERHPAQTEVYMEDVPVGTWNTTKFSGAVPSLRREKLVERANKLIDAVKTAREEANGVEVDQKKVADPVFAYLLGQ